MTTTLLNGEYSATVEVTEEGVHKISNADKSIEVSEDSFVNFVMCFLADPFEALSDFDLID